MHMLSIGKCQHEQQTDGSVQVSCCCAVQEDVMLPFEGQAFRNSKSRQSMATSLKLCALKRLPYRAKLVCFEEYISLTTS
jgi:hypothetical protein